METSTVVVGIDNGISGGLVAIGQLGHVMAMTTMPCKRERKNNEIDICEVWRWMTSNFLPHAATIVIEEPGGSKSAQAARSMAGSFHALRALCEIKHLKWHRITPQSWQKELLGKIPPGETKPRALALAKTLWPDEPFLATPRCKVPHDGLVDAALIAEYGRRL